MIKYLLIIALIAVITLAIFAQRATEKHYEKTNITFKGYNPEAYDDCRDVCRSTCPLYGWLYSGYSYEINDRNCVCFCLKEV